MPIHRFGTRYSRWDGTQQVGPVSAEDLMRVAPIPTPPTTCHPCESRDPTPHMPVASCSCTGSATCAPPSPLRGGAGGGGVSAEDDA